MTTFRRYLLFQIPGWCLAVAAVYYLWPMTGLGAAWGAAALAVFVAKDFLLYPLVRGAYEPAGRSDDAKLVGRTGRLVRVSGTGGTVLVAGERWRCRMVDGEDAGEGDRVRIVGRDGLVLLAACEG